MRFCQLAPASLGFYTTSANSRRKETQGTEPRGPLSPGDARGSDDSAGQLLLGEVPIERIATGAGFIDEGQVRGLGGELAEQVIDIALAGTDSAEGDNLGTAFIGGIGLPR